MGLRSQRMSIAMTASIAWVGLEVYGLSIPKSNASIVQSKSTEIATSHIEIRGHTVRCSAAFLPGKQRYYNALALYVSLEIEEKRDGARWPFITTK